MKRLWFRPAGWLYRPVAWEGFAVTAVAVLFCVQIILAADRRGHSVSDTFYGAFPYVVPAFLLWHWIASKTSE